MGQDINDAQSFLRVVEENSSIKFFKIEEADVETQNKKLSSMSIPSVPGTMALHQITWTLDTPSQIRYRDVSCLCGTTVCDCQPSKTFDFMFDNSNVESPKDHNVVESLKDHYVVVSYDGVPFPGIVLDEDDNELQVKCMVKVGHNRFIWPRSDDIIWYDKARLLKVIPSPTWVTKRHMQVDHSMWEEILQSM